MERITSITEFLDECFMLDNINNTNNILEIFKRVNLEFKYKDPKLKGELTEPYINMLLEYQKSVYHAYLSLQGKPENINYLTDEEKDALRVKFKIEDGSIWEWLSPENVIKFVEVVGKNMTGTQMLIGLIIIVAPVTMVMVHKYLLKKTELEGNNETVIKALEITENLSKKIVESNMRFQENRTEAIDIPLLAYNDNTFTTKEMSTTSQEAINRMEERKKLPPTEPDKLIKGRFYVDGISKATSLQPIFLLLDEYNQKYTISLHSNIAIDKIDILNGQISKCVDAEIKEIKKRGKTVYLLQKVKAVIE